MARIRLIECLFYTIDNRNNRLEAIIARLIEPIDASLQPYSSEDVTKVAEVLAKYGTLSKDGQH